MATVVIVAPPVVEAPTAPTVETAWTTCLGCDRPIPTGTVWCSWSCRNWDDRHDDGRDDWEPGWDE